MSVYVTLRIQADPAAFEKVAAEHAEAIVGINDVAKSRPEVKVWGHVAIDDVFGWGA